VSLSRRQIGVIARGAARELVWGLPAVAREVRTWRARALEIPDLTIREDALSSLDHKRGHTDGAALFWTIPRVRNPQLLRVLVAYEILLDFLDDVSERGAAAGQINGRQLHLALIDAVDIERPISDYYRYHPWRDDGGYARALVEACREGCAHFASYERVRAALVAEATRAQVLSINHELDPARRNAGLREWAIEERCEQFDVSWFELTGAASASLTMHALLTLTVEAECTDLDIERIRCAYFPWISAVTAMLDSYVDWAEDDLNGDHSYIAHYDTSQLAVQRVGQLIQRGLAEAYSLPNGERHALIVAGMVAMYLSKDSARTEEMRATTASFVDAGGSLTKALLPILRLWRIAYALRSA
jgi:tetraprenyl-beta-curcumene synthase